jgi:hypothetical protein
MDFSLSIHPTNQREISKDGRFRMNILPTPGSEDCRTISTISDFCSFHLAVFAWKPQEADGAGPGQDLRPIG